MADKGAKVEKKVKVEILPLHGIGGYGEAGAVVEMPESEARQYIKDGYVRIATKKEAPEPVKSEVAEKAEE